MEDSLAGIRALVALGDTGSFTLAATRLGISRTAVSKAVTRLEARLGVRLVTRASRGHTLTAEGQDFHLRCRQVLDDLAQAEASVSQQVPAGTVRMDVPLLFGRHWVMPLIRDLAAKHPALQFDVRFSNQVSELVTEGIDLAVRIGTLDDRAELVARPLGVQRTLICAAPAYLAQHGMPQTRADLALHACLGAGPAWQWPDADHATAPAVRSQLVLRDSGALLDAALAGAGLAQLPAWLVDAHLHAGALQQVLPDLPGIDLPIHAVWPRGRHLPPRVRLVIDALLDYFSTQSLFMR